jgi:hypothetical protein
MNEKPPKTDDLLNAGGEPVWSIGDSPSAIKVKNFLSTMNAVGPEAEVNYAAAVREMKKDPAAIVAAISEAIGACGRHQYSLRWAMIYAATQLRHPAAIPLLRDLVLTPIPPEESKQPHSFSTVGEETILRTTAIEGLSYLAAKGNNKAIDSLFDFLSIPSISIRRASVQAILVANSGLKNKVAKCLPSKFHYLLNVAPKKVQQVPQVKDPKRHLSRKKVPVFHKPPRLPEDQIPSKCRKKSAPKTGG